MLILAPIVLILISFAVISVIILRKKSYINKLHVLNTAGSDPMTLDHNFSWKEYGMDFFPELIRLFNKIDWHKHRSQWLMETEKLLRKTRLLFLRVDRLSEGWIKKIRKIHSNGHIAAVNPSLEAVKIESAAHVDEAPSIETKMSPAFFKNEEQRLIIEIAKNPKNNKLYSELGDLYCEMENWADAKESYEAAIELNSHDVAVKEKLSLVLERINTQN